MGNITSYIMSESNNSYRKYGWTRDIPDHRDKIRIPNLNNVYEPDKNVKSTIDIEYNIDLRNKCPGIYNQGKLGSCTANAIAAAFEYDEIQNKGVVNL